MRLRQLLDDLPIRPPAAKTTPTETPAGPATAAALNMEIRGVTHDSRQVRPGDLFVAVPGEVFDGRKFAPQAATRGAVAVLGRGDAPSDLEVPWLEAEDPRSLLGPLSSRVYGQPHEKLRLVGVTGTNGKSTIVTVMASLLETAGIPSGSLGTLGYRFKGRAFESALAGDVRTTPEAPDLFRILEEMRREGAAAVAMEVSSHALVLGRVEGARYDVAIFTNLSHDHLDFHGDMESYFAAKRQLFNRLKPGGRAVVHLGDAWGRRLAAELAEVPGTLTFGEGGDVTAVAAELDLESTRGRIRTPRGEFDFVTPLLGRYNLENVLAVTAAAEALGLPLADIAAGLAHQRPVSGRLEAVDGGQNFPAFIDYAHTPAALEAALTSLRELGEHQLVVVFGCGGDRDRTKRSLMGEIAGRLADLPVATSDNPRGEDPMVILRAVESGLRKSGNTQYRLVPDRREAIQRAVNVAASRGKWAVLVAGKGHEEEQIIGGRKIPFSDRKELQNALRNAGRKKRKVAS